MKKSISLLLGTMLFVVALTGCTPKNAGNTNQAGGTDIVADTNSQQVEVDGHNGPIKLTVEFENETIKSVTIDEHVETAGVADGALEKIPTAIVENQSVAVDTVAGATVSSKAIIKGVEEAIQKAGLDISKYQTVAQKDELLQGETEETDVVIVGAGVAGLSAAIELKLNSPETNFIILEKMPDFMGSVPRSGGAIFATGSDINIANDKDTSIDDLYTFMNQHSDGIINEPLFRRAFGLSAETVKTLDELGLEFEQEDMMASTPYLPTMHAIKTKGGGVEMAKQFHQIAIDLGIEIRTESPATGLIVEDGVVKGVNVEDKEKKYDIKADKVILASGGFAFDEGLMEKYAPEYAKNMMMPVSGTTGDAIKWTEQFGTELVGKGLMGSHRIDAGHRGPDTMSTFIITKEGKRFMNESMMYFEKHVAISEIADSHAYGILDSNFDDIESLEKAVNEGWISKFETIEEVADHFGINKENLVAEVEAYNKAYEDKQSPGYDLPADKMLSMSKAPYYAFDVIANALGTIPGLKVNENCQILAGDGTPITNLYGAGELIMGNFFSNSYPGSGMGIGCSTYSGRIAAIEAAKNLNK